ncbi:hypothetical protein M409DRAFT_50661 [Zasmidium cellare ATCC 36951]|uniref:Heterokaryon incompatibility domain-containing protein n=1 Tax=Zasmidium cellare ATCC 36951 TaxID=1080233 RepID=A0A6A6CVP8_ZASCE|nr:uncharacterized protein M409DRAFT_50661 [Zasmidium cellare ATCC 36951]KAF2171191.1 hypothetical protein M409DRAFT_50661 [Zasmidium cellare ATCC 36951]
MSTVIYPPYSSLSLPNDQSSFRLLSIQGSVDVNSPIVTSLRLAQLDEKPEFEALSYHWGTGNATEDVLVNNEKLPVTPNLAAALRALRLQNKARVVWIDAICINQAYNPEKNLQVGLMRRIFATSSRVVVWLGHSDTLSHEAFKVMQKPAGKRYQNVLEAVLRRPWFRRVWVVQEVAFAPSVTVQCGSDTTEWDSIIRHCSQLGRLRSVIDPDAPPGSKHFHPSFYPRILDATRRKVQAGGRLPLLEALRSFRAFDSTRAVDKVYSILGLLEDPKVVTVAYDRPAEDVFREVAIYSIHTSQRLDLFRDCLPEEGHVPVNTWVPDWASKEQAVEHDIEYFAAEEPFGASCDSPFGDVAVGQHGSLQVSAQVIATIAELSQGLPSYEDIRKGILPSGRVLPSRRWFEVISHLLSIPESWSAIGCRINGDDGTLQDQYGTNETAMEALYNTLCNLAPPFSDLETARQFDKWMTFVEMFQSAARRWQTRIAQALPWMIVWLVSGPYAVLIVTMLLYHAWKGDIVLNPPRPPVIPFRSTWLLGRTDNDLLGIFPAPTFVAPRAISSRVGDAVMILKGGARPYVLRKEESKWRLIGDAYVHGIMHGAAFDESKCMTIELL